MDGKEREKKESEKKNCSVRSLEFSSCHHLLVYLLEYVRNSRDLTGFRLCPGLPGHISLLAQALFCVYLSGL